jgi:DNA-binding LacI/PurR family transcriptional regulator
MTTRSDDAAPAARRGRPRVNIRDVAKLAGVSVATVSRVVSSSDYPVKAETRERVMQAVQNLHFYPNDLARGLFQERTNTIGVIVPDASNPYYPEILRGVEDLACQWPIRTAQAAWAVSHGR